MRPHRQTELSRPTNHLAKVTPFQHETTSPQPLIRAREEAETPAEAVQPHYGLQRHVLGPLETLAQSISTMAPTSSPAMTVPLVFATAGNGTWLAYLLATLYTLLVACALRGLRRNRLRRDRSIPIRFRRCRRCWQRGGLGIAAGIRGDWSVGRRRIHSLRERSPAGMGRRIDPGHS